MDAGDASQPDGATVRSQSVIPDEDKGVPDAGAIAAGDPATGAVEPDGWPGPIDEPPPLLA